VFRWDQRLVEPHMVRGIRRPLGHTDPMSSQMSSRRRSCPECRREIAVVAGRFARHDPRDMRGSGELVSCPGSRRQAQLGAAQPALDGYAVPEFPGQIPLF